MGTKMNQKTQELLKLEKKEEALQVAIVQEKRTPYVADAHCDLAYMYQVQKQWVKAYEEYSIARELNIGGNTGNISIEQIDMQKENVLKQAAEELDSATKEEILTKKTFYRLYGNSGRIELAGKQFCIS